MKMESTQCQIFIPFCCCRSCVHAYTVSFHRTKWYFIWHKICELFPTHVREFMGMESISVDVLTSYRVALHSNAHWCLISQKEFNGNKEKSLTATIAMRVETNAWRMGFSDDEDHQCSNYPAQPEWSKRKREFIFSFACDLCTWYTRTLQHRLFYILFYFIVNWTACALCMATQFSLTQSYIIPYLTGVIDDCSYESLHGTP